MGSRPNRLGRLPELRPFRGRVSRDVGLRSRCRLQLETFAAAASPIRFTADIPEWPPVAPPPAFSEIGDELPRAVVTEKFALLANSPTAPEPAQRLHQFSQRSQYAGSAEFPVLHQLLASQQLVNDCPGRSPTWSTYAAHAQSGTSHTNARGYRRFVSLRRQTCRGIAQTLRPAALYRSSAASRIPALCSQGTEAHALHARATEALEFSSKYLASSSSTGQDSPQKFR